MVVPQITAQHVNSWTQAGKKIEVTESSPSGGGRLEFKISHDGETPTWYFKYYRPGKSSPTRVKLGNAGKEGNITLREARDKAGELRELWKNGVDPKNERNRIEREKEELRREQQARGSLKQLFCDYVEYLKTNDKSSWPQVERALITGKYAASTYFPTSIKAAEVTPHDIKDVLAATHRRGSKGMAHHLRSYIRSAFSYGITHEFSYIHGPSKTTYDIQSNPAAIIPRDRNAVNKVNRILSTNEIASLWTELPETEISNKTLSALQLIICTGGQRVTAVVEAPVAEFNLEEGIWIIPPSREKSRTREHQVVLSERAITIISQMIHSHDSQYLFPNSNDPDRPMPFTTLNHAISRFYERKERPRWTPRDIRRTVRSMLADVGVNKEQLDFFLSHGRGAGTGYDHYDRSHRIEIKRGILKKWDATLDDILNN